MLNVYVMFLYKSTNNSIQLFMKKIIKKVLIYIICHKRLHKLKFIRNIHKHSLKIYL